MFDCFRRVCRPVASDRSSHCSDDIDVCLELLDFAELLSQCLADVPVLSQPPARGARAERCGYLL
jgi:hypothetical protein